MAEQRMNLIPVIDLFAGPGGLNEGFSRLKNSQGEPVFSTVGSFEMEATAVRTLKLRDVYWNLERTGNVPEIYYEFIRGEVLFEYFASDPRIAAAYEEADLRVNQVELGSDDDTSDALIRDALTGAGVFGHDQPWALIGGPPCQAYSLAGRSRRANDSTFAEDKKHFLYREYLRIIRTFKPSVFVMENVKGLLSSTTSGESMFKLIKRDLEQPNGDESLVYDIHSVVVGGSTRGLKPRDFIIRSELYGVPQKRHRVIMLGVRRGFLDPDSSTGKLAIRDEVNVKSALAGMPKLRSGISPKTTDSIENWINIRDEAGLIAEEGAPEQGAAHLTKGRPSVPREGMPESAAFATWVIDPQLDHVIQHESRYHMREDLKRYWYAANVAKASGVSPKLRDFPKPLLPNHKNAGSDARPFEDRFRVQVENDPATTIVSHIAKDGHYYIHPDPEQMRSMTVREAARLQTFPDNYFFMGNRTQQYHQVGNAVPPLLAHQIAKIVEELFRK